MHKQTVRRAIAIILLLLLAIALAYFTLGSVWITVGLALLAGMALYAIED